MGLRNSSAMNPWTSEGSCGADNRLSGYDEFQWNIDVDRIDRNIMNLACVPSTQLMPLQPFVFI